MTPLNLNTLAANAFRVLGLTAGASQADIDSAARKMRIWQDPGMIPATVNDADWIGPVSRDSQAIENAVSRLADPLSRLDERFWGFCQTPPQTDALTFADPSDAPAFHDAALVGLYRCLLGDLSGKNLQAWQTVVERFRTLAHSDDYLQWLLEAESDGDFEKCASLDEIASAQQQIPARLSTALARSVQDALEEGDFAAAGKAVQLFGEDEAAGTGRDELLDRMEDELAGRCKDLRNKIDDAWKTRKVKLMRPACNHAVSRFGTVIQPMIGQLVRSTSDVERHNRARVLGVELLMQTARAYEAFENYLASERTLKTAYDLAHGTPIAAVVRNLQEKARIAALRKKSGVGAAKQIRSFRLTSGGGSSGFSLARLGWILFLLAGMGRSACHFDSSSTSSNNSPGGFSPNNQSVGK